MFFIVSLSVKQSKVLSVEQSHSMVHSLFGISTLAQHFPPPIPPRLHPHLIRNKKDLKIVFKSCATQLCPDPQVKDY
jgi:hypothetical protein